ncbi:substrate-binding domain-containing protein [Paraburkholderia flava]|uniref:substrate-binding domain-containing protein n=1 Tax=Paraburkholderia flava TaxID=2547393 RepID=UPI0010621909|nr:substrate-binding domain-containing protein [Paraburkholderia flava]
MNLVKRKLAEAVVLACAAWASAEVRAQVPVVILGGGASSVAPAIASEITQFGLPITYYAVGSSNGERAFLDNDPTWLSVELTGTVHFANSDAALTPVQVDTTGSYARTSTDGKLIQLPYLVTPVTIPYVSQPSTVTGTVSLNDNDLCGIFSGKITDWNAIINPATGAAYTAASTPIKVVYRTDGSGMTDLLTRHLAKVCTTGAGGNSNIAFAETPTFASNFINSTPPLNFTGKSGDASVASQLVSLRTAGATAFGYLSPAYANTTLAPASTLAAANQLTVASLRNSHTNADVTPTYQNATLAIGTVVAPTTAADEANPFKWVPGANISSTDPSWVAISDPTVGYPISGTSNIIVSQCYKTDRPAPVVRIRMLNFLTSHYTNSSFAAILRNNGFDVVPTVYRTSITTDILANNSSPAHNLNIGNPTACGSLGR